LNKRYLSLMFRSSVFLVISAVTPSIANALEAPSDTRGTLVALDEIKWEWANSAGAVRYQLDINGVFVDYVDGNSYYSRDLPDGDYTFTVQAVNSDNRHSNPSARSAVVRVGTAVSNNSNERSNDGNLFIPSNVQGTQTGNNSARFTWTGVQGAESYIVYLNGDGQNPIQTYDEYLVIDNLSEGDHSAKVATITATMWRHLLRLMTMD